MEHEFFVKLLFWGLGICVSGFFFLAGWMWWLVGKLHDKVSYEWLENQFQKNLNVKMDTMNITLVDIKNALVGTFESKGVITKVEENQQTLLLIKEKCARHHPDEGKRIGT